MYRLQQTISHIQPSNTTNHNNPNDNNNNNSHELAWYVDCQQLNLKPLPSHYIIRTLQLDDYHKNIFLLMAQLTVAPNVSYQQFQHTYNIRHNCTHHTYNTVVIEDTARSHIIACATLLIEYKYIRECGIIGHIEDVCVDKNYRGNDLGLYVTYALINRAKQLSCYKVILDCEPHNMKFYERCGFKENAKHMALYLK